MCIKKTSKDGKVSKRPPIYTRDILIMCPKVWPPCRVYWQAPPTLENWVQCHGSLTMIIFEKPGDANLKGVKCPDLLNTLFPHWVPKLPTPDPPLPQLYFGHFSPCCCCWPPKTSWGSRWGAFCQFDWTVLQQNKHWAGSEPWNQEEMKEMVIVQQTWIRVLVGGSSRRDLVLVSTT